MKKREMILVVVAGAILIYGLLDVFVFSRKTENGEEKKIAAGISRIEAFAATAGSELTAVKGKSELPDTDYLFSKAESKWQNDPFMVYDAKHPDETMSTDKIQKLSYSGFIKAGDKVLAIVNGMEYAPGEKLKDAGYTVVSIKPLSVVLLTESNKEIILQLEEN